MEIAEGLRIYQQHLMANGRSLHTIRQYARHVGWFIEWGRGENVLSVGDVSPTVLARFLCADVSCRRGDGELKMQTTVNCLRSSLRSFFDFHCAAGHVASDPARLIARAHCVSVPPRGLTEAEIRRLLIKLDENSTFEGRRDRTLVRLLLAIGLRIGAALSLTRASLCWETSTVEVLKGKRGRQDRFFVPNDVFRELIALLAEHGGETLFTNRGGKALSIRQVQRRFSALAAAAELRPGTSAHTLRHTFALRLLRATEDIALVKAAMAHESVASTLVYAKVDSRRVKKCVLKTWEEMT